MPCWERPCQQSEQCPPSHSPPALCALQVLRKLPGVTEGNYRRLMAGLGSLAALADVPLPRLEELMGGHKAAKALHSFVHARFPAVTS